MNDLTTINKMNNEHFNKNELKKLIIGKVIQELKIYQAIHYAFTYIDLVIYFDNLIFDWVQKNWKEINGLALDKVIKLSKEIQQVVIKIKLKKTTNENN